MVEYLGEAMERQAEWRRLTRKLDSLYAAQAAGDDSVRTRQRIAALEAIQMALCGSPEAMAATAP
ncbi:hypothetical protein ACOZDZ_18010 [Streptomyces griseoincarnatus]|uniref:hypothetical protein n=1 Tax=Streptomyces sp. E2N171 TaxID=1851914 RepID=UPI000EF577A4|nr:hypothetical protein [Streptomyces sp. E2N171]